MVDIDNNVSDNKDQNTAPVTRATAKTNPAAAPQGLFSKFLFAIFGGSKTASSAPQPSGQNLVSADMPAAPMDQADNVAASRGPLMTVVMRNEFYRDGFRNMMRVVIVESIIIVVLIISFIVYMNASKPADHYFATTADGRIMQLVPLERPNMGTSALMSWVAQSAAEVMTFGFHDYQRRMQQSSRHFTRHGWETFTNALQKSRIIESVEASQQVVSAQPRSAPILIQEGIFSGKYRWVVDLPLNVTYMSGGSSRVDALTIRLVIDRVSSLENPNGVGIEQWIAM